MLIVGSVECLCVCVKAFKSNEWAQCGPTWGSSERDVGEVCVQCIGTGRGGGLSADCHVEARRTPELIYYFNSRSKCLPFVCSCFTISAECRVINDASLWGLPPPSPPPLPQPLPLYHIMRKHGVVNRFSNAASIGICVYFGRREKEHGEGEWGIWFLSGFCGII